MKVRRFLFIIFHKKRECLDFSVFNLTPLLTFLLFFAGNFIAMMLEKYLFLTKKMLLLYARRNNAKNINRFKTNW